MRDSPEQLERGEPTSEPFTSYDWCAELLVVKRLLLSPLSTPTPYSYPMSGDRALSELCCGGKASTPCGWIHPPPLEDLADSYLRRHAASTI